MAEINRLRRLLRGLREDVARMQEQVALTPTLLGDAADPSAQPTEDPPTEPRRRSADFRRLLA